MSPWNSRTSSVELGSLSQSQAQVHAHTYAPLPTGPDLEAGLPTQDSDDRSAAARWPAKRLLKIGLGIGSAGLALAGGAAGAAAWHRKGMSHTTQPVPAAPAGPTPAPAAALSRAVCTPPAYANNATASATLTRWHGDGTAKAPPLYGPEGPRVQDAPSGYEALGFYGTAIIERATLLFRLAEEPDAVRRMIRKDGESYIVRLYDRDEATNAFFAVDVRVEPQDLAHFQLGEGVPCWWAVVVTAGAKLDGHLGFVAPTSAEGDRADNNRFMRQSVETVVGGYTESVAGNELEAMRRFEDGVINRFVSTYDNAVPRAFEDDARTGKPDAAYAASLLQAKSDNWPAIFARMQDPRNLCIVTLSQPLDVRIESWAKNASEIVTPGGSTVRLNGPLGYFQANTQVVFSVPGHAPATLKTGWSMPYAVMEANSDGAWLQGLGRAQEDRVWMPYDLLVASVADATISRRPCQEDSAQKIG